MCLINMQNFILIVKLQGSTGETQYVKTELCEACTTHTEHSHRLIDVSSKGFLLCICNNTVHSIYLPHIPLPISKWHTIGFFRMMLNINKYRGWDSLVGISLQRRKFSNCLDQNLCSKFSKFGFLMSQSHPDSLLVAVYL